MGHLDGLFFMMHDELVLFFFFLNDPPTPEFYPLPLHDALPIYWHDHPPAVVNEQGDSFEWNEIPLEHLQQTLSTHWPVCWNCHIAEAFRRRHPELVTDRPAH